TLGVQPGAPRADPGRAGVAVLEVPCNRLGGRVVPGARPHRHRALIGSHGDPETVPRVRLDTSRPGHRAAIVDGAVRGWGHVRQAVAAQRHGEPILAAAEAAVDDRSDPVVAALEPEAAGQIVVGPALGAGRDQLEIVGSIAWTLPDRAGWILLPDPLAPVVV